VPARLPVRVHASRSMTYLVGRLAVATALLLSVPVRISAQGCRADGPILIGEPSERITSG
jgi:hypothetical protein